MNWNSQTQTTTIKLKCDCGAKATIKVKHNSKFINPFGDITLAAQWAKGLKKT
jgi:hypothetical protein